MLVDEIIFTTEHEEQRMGRKTYPEKYREQIVALARAGRSLSSLAREFEPSIQTIRKWVERADGKDRSADSVWAKKDRRMALSSFTISMATCGCGFSPHIVSIHEESRGVYGAPRVQAELRVIVMTMRWRRVSSQPWKRN